MSRQCRCLETQRGCKHHRYRQFLWDIYVCPRYRREAHGRAAHTDVEEGEIKWGTPTAFLSHDSLYLTDAGGAAQNVLLSMTNTFEGSIFIDTDPAVTNITKYTQNLFPLLTPAQSTAVAEEYAKYSSTLPTAEDQAVAIMGEGVHVL